MPFDIAKVAAAVGSLFKAALHAEIGNLGADAQRYADELGAISAPALVDAATERLSGVTDGPGSRDLAHLQVTGALVARLGELEGLDELKRATEAAAPVVLDAALQFLLADLAKADAGIGN